MWKLEKARHTIKLHIVQKTISFKYKIMSIIAQQSLKMNIWAEPLKTYYEVWNKTPIVEAKYITSEEAWTSKRSNLTMLRVLYV